MKLWIDEKSQKQLAQNDFIKKSIKIKAKIKIQAVNI